MFDRLTRSLYDELSRDPFARFVKLFDPSERVSFITKWWRFSVNNNNFRRFKDDNIVPQILPLPLSLHLPLLSPRYVHLYVELPHLLLKASHHPLLSKFLPINLLPLLFILLQLLMLITLSSSNLLPLYKFPLKCTHLLKLIFTHLPLLLRCTINLPHLPAILTYMPTHYFLPLLPPTTTIQLLPLLLLALTLFLTPVVDSILVVRLNILSP